MKRFFVSLLVLLFLCVASNSVLYGMEVNVKIDETDEFDCKAEIESDGVTYCRARFLFKESEFHGEDY